MAFSALPAIVLFEEQDVGTATTRADGSVRPATRNQELSAVDWIREVYDCFLECGWLLFHALIMRLERQFVNYIIALN
jgi:hypothetical protein